MESRKLDSRHVAFPETDCPTRIRPLLTAPRIPMTPILLKRHRRSFFGAADQADRAALHDLRDKVGQIVAREHGDCHCHGCTDAREQRVLAP